MTKNKIMNFAKKNKIPIAIMLIVIFCIGILTCVVRAWDEEIGENPILGINQDRSHILLEGKGYALDKQEEEEYKEEQEKTKEKIKEELSDENNIKSKIARSYNQAKIINSQKANGNGTGDNIEGKGEGNDDKTSGADEGQISKLPKIITNLKDGQKVDGSRLTFDLQGEDYKGNQISVFNFEVNVNSTKLYSSGESNYKRTYRSTLKNGKNEVKITIKDNEGNINTKYFTVIADTSAAQKKIGTCEVTLDLRTIGLGYKFKTTVTIYDGDNLAHAIARALEAKGYSSVTTTSQDLGMYFREIKKNGITNGYKIPKRLEKKLDDAGISTMEHDANSIGEFDFYYNSGFIYLYNGEYMGTGTSNIKAKDGDEIVFAFTLNHGKEFIPSSQGGWADDIW